MNDKQFHGVYAAVLTPRFDGGVLDLPSFRQLLQFLRERGMRRFALNGATGEFCLTTPAELQQLLQATREQVGTDAEILCGVGGAGLAQTEALIQVAHNARVSGLLLPMPHFFPYSQEDLAVFCRAVAAGTRLPILLYNLPQFTTGLHVDVVCDLLATVPNLVGVKDSSGSLDIVTALGERVPQACRIIGNDSALAEALREGLCEGVVSGVACALPELIQALFHAEPGSPAFETHHKELDEFILQLNAFPTPWGLKWAAEARGAIQARFALPVSPQRQQAARDFQAWLRRWLPARNTILQPASTNF